MIKFSKKDKATVHRLHLLSGKPYAEVREFYEFFVIDCMLSYLENREASIPLFGDFKIKYLGDSFSSKGRVAKVDVDFNPDDFLLHTIGQMEDDVESDIEAHLKEKIRKLLTDKVETDE